MLADSIVRAVMEADGVDPHELEAMLTQMGRNSGRAPRTRWSMPRTAETRVG
ncbi:MAG: hypothetical protein QOI40_1928, partial [Alphaproteobacteria bacterium]|nr:hypothetical protein [Alphaproteobacteria bacterium]